MPVRPALNLRIADRLLEEGFITEADHERAVDYARTRNLRVEEALLEVDALGEAELLGFVSRLHQTQFVSTERLSRAKVDQAALRLVPKKLAELYALYPLLHEPGAHRLVVATADPDNLTAFDELKAAARVREVRALVARPAAVAAAIARGYDGETYAFTDLLRGVEQFGEIRKEDPFQPERPTREPRPAARRLDGAPAGAPRPEQPERPAPRMERADGPAPARGARPEGFGTLAAAGGPSPFRAAGRPRAPAIEPDPPAPAEPRAQARRRAEAAPARHPKPLPPAELDEPLDDADTEEVVSAPPTVPGRAPPAEPDPPPRAAGRRPAPAPPVEPQELPVARPRAEPRTAVGRPGRAAPAAPPPEEPESAPASVRSFGPRSSRLNLAARSRHASERPPSSQLQLQSMQLIEVLRVLVGLLENEREELRGHSSLVARLTQDACARIHLPEAHTAALVIAAYLHDLGKRGVPAASRPETELGSALHLTALNVSQFAPHRDVAAKLVGLPEQLMASANLPSETVSALRTMYEQVGGKGLPSGLAGQDIPIGGRILAVADSYADLTQNPRNTFAKVLTPDEAMEELRRCADVVFDPNIIDVFEHAKSGEKILTQLLDESHRVLIVDPDPEQTLVLQLRLSDQGFEVHLARNTKEARAKLAAHKIALVVSEIDLEERDAGLFLREEVAKGERGHEIAWVFLSARSSRNTAKRAFDMGVDDFIAKPTSADIVVAKLLQLVERLADREKPTTPRGVSGSLSDMGLTDLVQILYHGRRTCSLHVEAGDLKGEVHFQAGQIHNVLWGDAEGEKAFYRLLAQSDNGRFRVDPSFVPDGEPKIQRSPEGLLLEGMRLIDEKIVP